MDYYTLATRLIAIKREIHELRNLDFQDIPHRVGVLKLINILLDERNHLLLIKQEMICKNREFLIMAKRSDASIERVYNNLNNKVASMRIRLHTKPVKSGSNDN